MELDEDGDDVAGILKEKSDAQVVELLNAILATDGWNKNAGYEKRLLNPCIELLAELGRSKDFLENTILYKKDRLLSQVPITVYNICARVTNVRVASRFIS